MPVLILVMVKWLVADALAKVDDVITVDLSGTENEAHLIHCASASDFGLGFRSY